MKLLPPLVNHDLMEDNMKKALYILTLVLLSLALLTSCGSSGKKLSDTDEIDDGYGTVTRNGKHTLVCVCHDPKAIQFHRGP